MKLKNKGETYFKKSISAANAGKKSDVLYYLKNCQVGLCPCSNRIVLFC